jgi:hypothetical protein
MHVCNRRRVSIIALYIGVVLLSVPLSAQITGGSIDVPSPGQAVSGSLQLSGWASDSSAAMNAVNVSIDGVSYGAATPMSRPDACSATGNPPGCPNIGWFMQIDVAALSIGSHMLTISPITTDGRNDPSMTRAFSVQAATAFGVIDVPAFGQTVSGSVVFQGWATNSADPVGSVNVYIDNVSCGTASPSSRPDACSATGNPPGCPNVGWNISVNTAGLSVGSHTLSVLPVTTDGQADPTVTTVFNVGSGTPGYTPEPHIVEPIGGDGGYQPGSCPVGGGGGGCANSCGSFCLDGVFCEYDGSVPACDLESEGWIPTCPFSPIVIDSFGEGFHLTSLSDGVKFKVQAADVTSTKTSWTDPRWRNGWLALDRNGNGTIDNFTELFGNLTPQPVTTFQNGYAALAVFDNQTNGGNGNGLIDPQDSVFEHLRVWIDANHDGISQPAELHALQDLGIFKLSLQYAASDKTDANGNQFRYEAHIWDEAGDSSNVCYDVYLRVDASANGALRHRYEQ